MKKIKEKIMEILETEERPLTFSEIKKHFDIKQKKDEKKLKKHLKDLIKQGKILKTKSNTYCLVDSVDIVRGTIKFKSFGFAKLIPDPDFEIKEVLLKGRSLLEALDEDRALVRIDRIKPDGTAIGTIVEIIERGHKEIVGIFQKNRNFGFVIPLDKKIVRDFYIPQSKINKARSGDTVLVKILQYPTRFLNPVGEIVKVLGKQSDYNTLITTVNYKYGFKDKFSIKTRKYVEKLDEDEIFSISKKRKDLRNLNFFTIDGDDAKDFDDSVAIKKTKEGYKLYVSIADVEYFVPPNSSIDKDAYENATSVYYPDKVNPMLPEKLSNNICSLNPNKDRFCFTVEIDLNRDGEILSYKFYKSVIRSRFRATYHKSSDVIEKGKDSEYFDEYKSIYEDLMLMKELALILRERRFKTGSIDFELPETKIILTPKGKVKNIVLRERGIADKIIEEFMLCANECVARFITERNVPMIYRVHDAPEIDKLERVFILARNLGIEIDIHDFSSHNIQKLLNEVKGKSFEKLVNFLTLRSMKQAKYSEENIGHYALAKECYTHFTSPIRRYPDLINHRILKRIIYKKVDKRFLKKLEDTLPKIAQHCSEMERKATEAEREVEETKKIEFLRKKIGEEFVGTITGVTNYGFFVEVDAYLIEGLVPIRNLTDDYYFYFEEEYLLRGKKTGNYYRLGDKVIVKIERVDKLAKEIDFQVVKKL